MSGTRRLPVRPAAVGLLALVLAAGGLAASLAGDGFDHVKHAKLFPTCEACHSGVAAGDFATSWPTAEGCAACHDGTIEERVEWSPPAGPGGNNLRFTHVEHGLDVARQAATDSVLECASCHIRQGEAWMTVRRASARRCLACHGSEVSPEVREAIAARYPGDRATGFAVGDLRGALWVEVPAGTP